MYSLCDWLRGDAALANARSTKILDSSPAGLGMEDVLRRGVYSSHW